MIFNPAEDRLRQSAEVNLIITAQESFAVQIGSPAHPRGQKIGVNLVMARGIKNAKQVRSFDGQIETWWFVGNCGAGSCTAIGPAECEGCTRES